MKDLKKEIWINRLRDKFDFEDYKGECNVKTGEPFSYSSIEYLFAILPITLQSFIQDLLKKNDKEIRLQERKKTLEEVENILEMVAVDVPVGEFQITSMITTEIKGKLSKLKV